MADKKLSSLSEALTLTDSAILYAVDGAVDYKISKENLLKFYNLLQKTASTGIIYTDGVTINADTTKFDIGAIKGFHVDNTTTPEAPVITYVDYAGTSAVTPTYLATHPVTYVAIDKDSNIIQSNEPFTNTQKRDYLTEFAVVHSDNTVINVINNHPQINFDVANQLGDLMHCLGFFNAEGNIFSANGANLNINKSIGKIFKNGSNYITNPKDPHVVEIPAESALTFRYRLHDSMEYADTLVIDPDFYDLAGVKTAVPSNKFTVQRIAIFTSGIVRAQYGQIVYDTMASAVAGINTDAFIIEQNIAENGLIRCALILRQGTMDLTNALKAKFVEIDKFGGKASTGGISVSTLQSAYNNSIIPQVLTDSSLGAVTLQRGSTADTDKVFEIQDGAGNAKEFITGEGFKSIRYRDEYASSPLLPAGLQAAPDFGNYNFGTLTVRKYAFDGSTTPEYLSSGFEIAHDVAINELNAETEWIEVHIHWRPSTNNAGEVKWFFDYVYSPINSAPLTSGTMTVISTVNVNEQFFHKVNAFTDSIGIAKFPKPSTGFNIGDLIIFSLRRDPTDVEDTYVDDAIFEKVAIHVPTNDRGSRQLYVK